MGKRKKSLKENIIGNLYKFYLICAIILIYIFDEFYKFFGITYDDFENNNNKQNIKNNKNKVKNG